MAHKLQIIRNPLTIIPTSLKKTNFVKAVTSISAHARVNSDVHGKIIIPLRNVKPHINCFVPTALCE